MRAYYNLRRHGMPFPTVVTTIKWIENLPDNERVIMHCDLGSLKSTVKVAWESSHLVGKKVVLTLGSNGHVKNVEEVL